MDLAFWIELIAFVVLLGFSGFFSSSETSLFSLSSIQIEQMRRDAHPRVGLIERLLSEPRRLIVTILIGNEFVNVAASVISAAMVIDLMGAENKYFNLFIMVPILLLFGEITPKTLAIRNNVAFAGYQSRPIDLFARAISPLRWVVREVADLFITLVVGKQRSRGNIITEDMVRTLAQEAVGEGALDQTEAQFIHQIFDFGSKTLEDIMTPRADIDFLSVDTPLREALREVRESRQSRLPVYDTHRDNVLGILHARDLLKVDFGAADEPETGLRGILRKPYFVPESKSATQQFNDFRKRRRSFALTVDEYGGVTGLVTMEDLLECIFGDIPSPSDEETEHRVEELEERRWRVEGTLPIAEFNAHFGASLPDDSVETVGGLVMHTHGELPAAGSAVDIEGFRFTVVSLEGNRIGEMVTELPAPGADPENMPDSPRPVNAEAGADGSEKEV